MKFLKFLAVVIMLFFSLFPTLLASVYVFGGRESLMKFLAQIPLNMFRMFGIPLFIVTMAASVGLIWYMMFVGLSPDKPAKPLSIDDPNLEKKLAKLYN